MKHKTSLTNALIVNCMLCDVVIRPFYAIMALNARTTIIYSVASSILTLVVVLGVLAVFNAKFENIANNKAISFLYFVLFIVSSAASLVRAEQFYRYSSSVKTSLAVFIICVGLVCVYAAFVPISSLVRVSKVVLALMTISFILIFISNQTNVSFQNLQFEFTEIKNYNLLYTFNFAPEILLFLYLDKSELTVKLSSFTRIIITVFTSYLLLTILCELVLGTTFTEQTQPIYTLARLGDLSVFKRLDSLHISIWLFSATIKICAFFAASVNLLPKKIKMSTRVVVGILLLISVSFILYGTSTQLQKLLLSTLTILTLCVTAIFSKAKKVIEYEKSV